MMTYFYSSAQKQLDSIISYQFKNNGWEPAQRSTYEYGQNTRIEYQSGFFEASQSFELTGYYKEGYDADCDDALAYREVYGSSQDPYLKTSTSVWDRDAQCRLVRQSLIRAAAGDTSQRYDYSDFDINGNARSLKFYNLNSNNQLVLNFEREYVFTYTSDKKIQTSSSYNIVNNVSTPLQKTEYAYINDKIKSIKFNSYSPSTADYKLFQELQYTYDANVEVLTTIVHNTGSPQVIRIDSTILDNDKDILQVLSYEPIGSGFASTTKSDYYYTKTSTALDEIFSDKDIEVKFFSNQNDELNFTINALEYKNVDVNIYDISGRSLFNKSYKTKTIIEDRLINITGLKVVNVYGDYKLIYSKIVK